MADTPPGYLSNAALADNVQEQTAAVKNFKDEQVDLYTSNNSTVTVTDAAGQPVVVPSFKAIAAGGLASQGIYSSIAAGIAAVADGQYFQVPSADLVYLSLYRRAGGGATLVNTTASATGVNTLVDEVDQRVTGVQTVATTALGTANATAAIIARNPKKANWLQATRDKAKRLLHGIRDDGTEVAYKSERTVLTVLTSLALGGSSSMGRTVTRAVNAYPGMLWAYIDGSRRKLVALMADGSAWAHKAVVAHLFVTNLRYGSAAVRSDSWIAYTAADAAGDYQVFKQSNATGVVAQLTTSGNHTGLQINGSVVTWLVDGVRSEYADLDAGTLGPIFPQPTLLAIGHSMLADYAIERQPPLPHRVAAALGWDVIDFAIQGDRSAQQLARTGLVPTTVTVDGNTIPADGFVNITAQTPDIDWIFASYGASTIYGWLDGVHGAVTWDSSAGERFQRTTPGDAVAIPAGATWIADVGGAFNSVALLWMLVNDDKSTPELRAASLANLTTVVNSLKALGKRFVILREFARPPDETPGSQGRANRDALNDLVHAAYPNNWLDVIPAVQAGADPTSADDTAAVANGFIPPSLTVDGLHLNNAGNAIAATVIVNFIKNKGWA